METNAAISIAPSSEVDYIYIKKLKFTMKCIEKGGGGTFTTVSPNSA